jgi:acyl-coenzyme A synthetase/AMP-(fatty) acid ligase
MQIYYDVPRERVFADADKIPIGKPFPNIRAFLVSDAGQVISEPGIRGEIYLAGSAISAGYYDDDEKTAAKFVQNPVQPHFREFVYKTGDIAVYDGDGNMTVVARADYQIKHMGYRIELPEIEQKANAVPNVALSCCVYDAKKDAIGLYYTGSADEAQMRRVLEKNLPRYMMPHKIICMETLPLTNNGKIDRVALGKCLGSDE